MNKKQDAFIWGLIPMFGFYIWGLNMGLLASKGIISHTFTWILFGALIFFMIVIYIPKRTIKSIKRKNVTKN